jgi:hypothetical protein
VRLRYGLKKEYDKPYYLNSNLCKYAEIRLSGFKFNYILMDTSNVETKNGIIILKNATKSFKIDVKIKNLDDLVDDFNINIQFDYLNGDTVSIKQIDKIKSSNFLVQLVAVDGILHENSVIYNLKSKTCQIISDKSIFSLKNGLLTTKFAYYYDLKDFLMNKTQRFSIKIQCTDEILNLNVDLIPIGTPFNLPKPYLDTFLFNITESTTKIRFYVDTDQQMKLNQIYNISYKFLTLNNQDYDHLPFKFELKTNQLYYLNKNSSMEYKFKIVFTFKFNTTEIYLPTQVNFKLKETSESLRMSDLKCDTSSIQTINFLSLPKWATYLQFYGKSQLLGFVRLKDGQRFDHELNYEFYNLTTGINQTIFELNTQNGALYLNDDGLILLRRQYQQQKLNINLFVRINSLNDSKLCRVRIRIQPKSTQHFENCNFQRLNEKFYTNTNNLLNFLFKGNEFLVKNVQIDENLQENAVVLNLKDYFRQNFNLKKYYYFENLLNSLNFTLIDDRYFHIESLSTNLVTNYQLNYETRQNYFVQIRIDQLLNQYEIDSIDDQVYTYYLDLKINIVNQIDELLSTKWPIYYLSFNLEQLSESDDDEITLFQLPIIDFEHSSTTLTYKSSIINKNLRNIFTSTKNSTITITGT